MSLEALYNKLANGTAKFRPRRSVLDVLTQEWMTTPQIQQASGVSDFGTLHQLKRLRAKGLVECIPQERGKGAFKWRLRIKEKRIWAK